MCIMIKRYRLPISTILSLATPTPPRHVIGIWIHPVSVLPRRFVRTSALARRAFDRLLVVADLDLRTHTIASAGR